MKECRFCKEEIKDKAIKCWHCNTMLRRSWLRWLLLLVFVVSALYSWLLSHQENGHLVTLDGLGEAAEEHLSSLLGVLGSVLVAGIIRSPMGE